MGNHSELTEHKTLISVIIPVYNVEEYLRTCLDSIASQTYSNLEIVLVDDGSTDKSPSICDEYQERDSRFRVIHKKNGGQSSARNEALDVATGEYISFVDGDDWLESDMYEVLINVINETGADIVACEEYNNRYGTKERKTISRNTREITVFADYDDIFSHIINSNPRLRFEIWNKLYKRDIIGETRFKTGQIYEEIYFQKIVMGRAKKVAYVDCALYNYRSLRPGSTVYSFDKKRLSKLEELDEYIRIFKERGRLDIANIYRQCAEGSVIDLYRMAVKQNKLDDDTRAVLIKKFKEYFKESGCRSVRHVVFRISPSLYDLCAAILK